VTSSQTNPTESAVAHAAELNQITGIRTSTVAAEVIILTIGCSLCALF